MNDHSRALVQTAAALPATVRFASAQLIPLVWLGGLSIAAIDRVGSAEFMLNVAIARRATGGAPPLITSANGQVLSMCARDPQVRALFDAADLIHADGTPLVLASRLRCDVPLPERVATTDLFHDVAERAQAVDATFYLLGATTEVIARGGRAGAAEISAPEDRGIPQRLFLRRRGEGGRGRDQCRQARHSLGRHGAPAEQRFCLRNRARLANVGLIKTSGGLFDFVSGRNSRAPGWIRRSGSNGPIAWRSSRAGSPPVSDDESARRLPAVDLAQRAMRRTLASLLLGTALAALAAGARAQALSADCAYLGQTTVPAQRLAALARGFNLPGWLDGSATRRPDPATLAACIGAASPISACR